MALIQRTPLGFLPPVPTTPTVPAPTGNNIKNTGGFVRDPTTGQLVPAPAAPIIDPVTGLDTSGLDKVEAKNTVVSQTPTNVYAGAQYQIPGQLRELDTQANAIANALPNFSNLRLNQNFSTAPNITGGIDLFGRQALGEGAQNIFAQQNRANQALSDQLGRTPGNNNLLSVLQSQNALRSQLAVNPLYAEAQKGTYERALSDANFRNNSIQLQNAANTNQTAFNNQNQTQLFQSRLAAIQPNQNLLDALISLQSQSRGINSSEASRGAKNFS
jgi:hypothetical protein